MHSQREAPAVSLAQIWDRLAVVHRASSIKVAEAAKVIENTQRDVNIALMNELSIIFHKLGIDHPGALTRGTLRDTLL